MRKTRRKQIRDRKKIKIVTLSSVMFIIMLGALLMFVNYKKSKDHLVVRPIPVGYDISSNQEQEINKLEKKLRENNIEFKKIERSGSYYVVILEDKSNVVLSRDKEIDPQIASLQFILSRLKMEGKAFKELDLRYDKPVIRE
jgi:uncharacterized membrane protein YvbJ